MIIAQRFNVETRIQQEISPGGGTVEIVLRSNGVNDQPSFGTIFSRTPVRTFETLAAKRAEVECGEQGSRTTSVCAIQFSQPTFDQVESPTHPTREKVDSGLARHSAATSALLSTPSINLQPSSNSLPLNRQLLQSGRCLGCELGCGLILHDFVFATILQICKDKFQATFHFRLAKVGFRCICLWNIDD